MIKLKTIKEIAEIIKTGKTPPSKEKKYFNGELNWYTPGDLDKSLFLKSSARKLTNLAIIERKAVLFPKGTLLIGCIGDIGKIGITTCDSSSNQQITGIYPKDDVDVVYLYYWFKGNKKRVEELSNNAVVPIINNSTLSKVKIPLPPLPVQQKIAAILDAADLHRQKTKTLIEKYDQLTQSIFLEMFGDPVTNPKGWKLEKFSMVGKLDRGRSKHRPRNAPHLLGGKYPLVQTGDIANSNGYIRSYKSTYSEIGLAQSKIWPKGTLCITIAANIAKTGILTFDACFPDSVVGFIPNEKTNNEYTQVWMSFLQRMIEESAPESAQKNINLAILRDLNIPLPPIKSQNLFANCVNKIEEQKERAKLAQKKSDELFNTLLQRAFKGELVN